MEKSKDYYSLITEITSTQPVIWKKTEIESYKVQVLQYHFR